MVYHVVMKRCNRCGIEKSTNEFNKKGNGFQPYCRPCDREASKARYHGNKQDHIKAVGLNNTRYITRNRDYVLEHLRSHPCVDCGTSDIRVLEFDHVRGEKSGNLSMMVAGAWPLEKIIAEVAKCEVRCANCHRIITQERSGSWRSLIAGIA
jgi:hypothetical protein